MRSILFLGLFPLLLAGAASGQERPPLKVVTTLPDLADIAREIGGERVEVRAIARGKENLHQLAPRPSDLVALSRADALVQVGLSLEASWLPGLVLAARNERIAAGGEGLVTVSEGWTPIDVPASTSRQGGDVHPGGNPHLNLDPRAGRHVADALLEALRALDPASRELFERRHADYVRRLEEAEARWKAVGERLRGAKVVTYHKEFDYLARLYGLEIAGTVELKPGIPPTPGHLARLVETMRAQKVGVVVTAAWSNTRQVDDLARKTGARVVELPNQVGGARGADTWIAMMDLVHARLSEALGAGATGG